MVTSDTVIRLHFYVRQRVYSLITPWGLLLLCRVQAFNTISSYLWGSDKDTECNTELHTHWPACLSGRTYSPMFCFDLAVTYLADDSAVCVLVPLCCFSIRYSTMHSLWLHVWSYSNCNFKLLNILYSNNSTSCIVVLLKQICINTMCTALLQYPGELRIRTCHVLHSNDKLHCTTPYSFPFDILHMVVQLQYMLF